MSRERKLLRYARPVRLALIVFEQAVASPASIWELSCGAHVPLARDRFRSRRRITPRHPAEPSVPKRGACQFLTSSTSGASSFVCFLPERKCHCQSESG